MSGHTAEKWWIDDDGFIASGRGDDYKTLAQIIDTGSNGENNANAALIAAAPELLETLKGLFEHCAMVHKHWGDNCNQREADNAIDAARQIIQKAEVQP
jgi:hypothetical protein